MSLNRGFALDDKIPAAPAPETAQTPSTFVVGEYQAYGDSGPLTQSETVLLDGNHVIVREVKLSEQPAQAHYPPFAFPSGYCTTSSMPSAFLTTGQTAPDQSTVSTISMIIANSQVAEFLHGISEGSFAYLFVRGRGYAARLEKVRQINAGEQWLLWRA